MDLGEYFSCVYIIIDHWYYHRFWSGLLHNLCQEGERICLMIYPRGTITNIAFFFTNLPHQFLKQFLKFILDSNSSTNKDTFSPL